MLLPLTEKQRVVFDAFADFYNINDYPPTQQEVSNAVNKASVSGELKALRKKGWLTSVDNLSRRNIIPTDEALQKSLQQDLFTEKRM